MQYNINKFVGVVAEEETFTLQIWGSHCGECENYSVLSCDATKCGNNLPYFG
jgi:hypothetical protein